MITKELVVRGALFLHTFSRGFLIEFKTPDAVYESF